MLLGRRAIRNFRKHKIIAMDITLPRRTSGDESPQLNGRRQITVVGANGSGKTRFINRMIADLGDRAFSISALNALYPVKDDTAASCGSVRSHYLQTLRTVQFVTPTAETEFEMLIFLLLNDEMNEMFDYKVSCIANGHAALPKTKIDAVVKLWKDVFPNSGILRGGKDKIRFTNDAGDDAFNPKRLSHGEKAVFFYIGASLYAPKGSVIFVDSPTMFLHRSVTQSLWTTIEGHRPDCTFVYLTHDIDFPTSRTDNVTVWVRSCNIADESWDYELIQPHDRLSDRLIIDLLGSRKPVLFVEGDDTHSLDFRLYSLIFPEYTVKPMGSCTKVIETVRSVNDIQGFHHLDSRGIVDRDRRNGKEVAYLREKKIYVPDVAEIENILMLEGVIRAVAHRHGRDPLNTFLKVKSAIVKLFKAELKQQALLHTRHRVKRTIEMAVDRRFRNINALEEHLDNLGQEIRPHDIYDGLCRDFNRYVQESDYRSILRVYNQKSMLIDSGVAQACGCKQKDDYIKSVFAILKSDDEDAAKIRTAIKQCFGITDPTEVSFKSISDSLEASKKHL